MPQSWAGGVAQKSRSLAPQQMPGGANDASAAAPESRPEGPPCQIVFPPFDS